VADVSGPSRPIKRVPIFFIIRAVHDDSFDLKIMDSGTGAQMVRRRH
jgi:hypothetical protein